MSEGREEMESSAIYPGSFDPITNGHVDIILRGAKLFPRVIVAVLENPKKTTLFGTEERIAIIREIFHGQKNVVVAHFHGLLVRFAKEHKARIVIRGLRAVSDFEYEFQMALMNQTLDPDLETLYMMPSAPYTFLSSSLVKEVFALGGSVKGLVPTVVESRLREKFNRDDPSLNKR